MQRKKGENHKSFRCVRVCACLRVCACGRDGIGKRACFGWGPVPSVAGGRIKKKPKNAEKKLKEKKWPGFFFAYSYLILNVIKLSWIQRFSVELSVFPPAKISGLNMQAHIFFLFLFL